MNESDKTKKINFAIDRGGTFTDVYAEVPGEKGFRVMKLLSSDPANYPDAPREGIRRILSEVTGRDISPEGFSSELIGSIRMGTTVATNALLERKGARGVLVTTKGFRDILKIGNQSRPDIFDLQIRKPELLYEEVIEIDERVRLVKDSDELSGKHIVTGSTGEKLVVLTEPEEEELRRKLSGVYNKGIRSIAVVFLHAYTFTAHEKLAGKIAEEIGFKQISLSHEVMPRVSMVARGDTTSVDAYLTPHIREYLRSFKSGFTDGLENTELLFMQSDGGLVPSDRFKGSSAILSGPAGGIVGYARTSKNCFPSEPVIGFDMGGTSTDVSRFGSDFQLVHETQTAGVRIQAPQMHIKTVAAGGGSRLFFRNGMFEVGPESSGAHPGPVCYRKGGYLSVTDANLFLGRIHPGFFPNIFGENEDQPLDTECSKKAFYELTEEVNLEFQKKGLSLMKPEEVALGFLHVANEVMVRPVREISVMRGYDIKEHVLSCFGGAGGQHACSVARELGIRTVFIHRHSGILSAYGMGLADVVVEKQEPSATKYGHETCSYLMERLDSLEEYACRELDSQGYGDSDKEINRYLNMRYLGTDTAIMIPQPPNGDFKSALEAEYKREYGFRPEERLILIDDFRVRVCARSDSAVINGVEESGEELKTETFTECYFEGGWKKTPVFVTGKKCKTKKVQGPAIIMQETSTIIVEPDCMAEIRSSGDIIIEVPEKTKVKLKTEADPVRLSIFSNLFMSVAEQMGRTLQKTAVSTNIKERLDFSCAIFDRKGSLVANAPHVPVHLGSMGEAVKKQIEICGDKLRDGDVILTNHPAAGGSHLPDITVITPVWNRDEIIFFVASRGHHADIGGISPGSMPPFSGNLREEGACIKSFKLVSEGRFDEKGISEILLGPDENDVSGTRRLSDNISDLKAQVAANKRGVKLLEGMVEKYSPEVVDAYMGHIQNNAAVAVRSALRSLSLSSGMSEVDTVVAEDFLDDGTRIVLKLTIDRSEGTAVFDFTETGDELDGNLNAPVSVTMSAVIYCLRCLVGSDIPLNQGCMEPVELKLRKGSLLSPSEDAAVVGGNVLTSQRITDVILKAFNVCAASQGCMNNFTFGSEEFGYYETIGGGAGAGPSWNGQSGVHTHMTNTRITDPEILERRYPVLLNRFEIRIGSGGRGKFSGGDGLVREIEFLSPLNAAILSERRVYSPYGLEGGLDGEKGKNIFIRKGGEEIDLGGKNEIKADKGDRICIMTPGGGGYGMM